MIGTSIWHHPTDVTVATFLLGTLAGKFDWINPQASRNARAVMRLPVEALSSVWNDPGQLRLELKTLLVYQQTDLRGRMLLATGTRLVTEATLSNWVFSLCGRIKRGGLTRKAVVFALAFLGSVYRISMRMHQTRISVMDTGPYPFLAAIISGEDRIFQLAREIGIDGYFAIRQYLRANPDAIQLQNAELELVQKAINWIFDAVEDPLGFPAKVEA